ncbi:YaiO family outer membrane beta-barrel protein [Cecembia calidifontis]|jgi:YaiO family outer membrane protein|uniref:YaiO family outer membrane protein n=1 Tax=Cecembia calidifontis TaxID=1187080 RepID=A0A4Q7PE61_9BACT|nr:YaiO family outer membrane beta-barrel protein [Cecembia calidifontis]RZS98068.1 YaiO family outer membrane protein [Cecembia calidifontis]
MRLLILFFSALLSTMFINPINAQVIDADSLLFAAIEKSKTPSTKQEAIIMGRIGIKEFPDYLDFHLLLGRIYKEQNRFDSARFFLNHVIEKNPNYNDAFYLLLNLEFIEKNSLEGLRISNYAIACFPDDVKLYSYKLSFFQLEKDERKEFDFLKLAIKKFPTESLFRQRMNMLEMRFDNDRIGVNYSLTQFNREEVGPWHLIGVQYIYERRWGSLIGRMNHANRLSAGNTIDSGYQLELESYFFTGKKSYSYVAAAYSPSLVFPEYRFGYSFIQNLKNGWEWEVGARYNSVIPPEGRRNFRSLIIGGAKYVGSWWLSLRSFVQNENDQIFPAFTFSSRYYMESRFDYFSIIAGYGTSPDERTTLGQFENRIALDSWRIGTGYNRRVGKRYITGMQLLYNYQEYAPGRTQHELELFFSLQFKL